MDTKPLYEIGLTDGEVRVYLALIELGSSTAGPIVNESNVSSSKIYEIIDRLIDKGLVSYVIKGKTKHFQAASPVRILDLVREKERHLEEQEDKINKLIPELEMKQSMAAQKPIAEIFEGLNGIKTFFSIMFKEFEPGNTYYCLGYPKESSEKMHTFFLHYHRKRQKLGTNSKIIYNHDAWYWKKREKREFTDVRVLPENLTTPSYINIYKDIIGTVILGERPICIMIRNKGVADSYRKYFDLLWEQSTQPEF